MLKKKILVVDDDTSVRQFLNVVFKTEGFSVIEAVDGEDALEKLKFFDSIDIVVMDLRMPGRNGLQILEEIKGLNISTKVIIMTGYATVKTAVEAMKLGAFDYIVKPFENDEMVAIVKAALLGAKKTKQSQTTKFDHKKEIYDEIIGHSPLMIEIYELTKKISRYNTTVLITGESGTGKNLLAKVIHKLSTRSQYPFITINCAVLPENLLESELFGHEKGSFTGAVSKRIGKFEMANKGTVFLDEIGTLNLQTQAKLLRVIQEKKFERVGGERTLEADIRIIAATNENLQEAVAISEFRQDLYYRLNVISIDMPSLRKRKEDIPDLITYFINKYNLKFGTNIRGITPGALELMLKYPWPGNVRELENVIERAAILADDIDINPECLPAHIRHSNKGFGASDTKGKKDTSNLDNVIIEVEKDIIADALEKTDGHRAKTAELLGISRRVLQYKLKKYGMLDG